MDLEELGKIAGAECKRQGCARIRDLKALLNAYEMAQNAIRKPTIYDAKDLASIIEPIINLGGYRRIPITFLNGGSSAPWDEIPRLMENLFEHGLSNLSTMEFVREFLWIHPFIDGNGRTAWVLYNWLNDSLDKPVALPDFKFGEGVG
jgi:hypothetical protein